MRFIGVDLHKRIVVVCVMEVRDGARVVVSRGRWACREPAELTEFCSQQPTRLTAPAG